MFWFNITTDLDSFLYSSYSLPANKSAISLSLYLSPCLCFHHAHSKHVYLSIQLTIHVSFSRLSVGDEETLAKKVRKVATPSGRGRTANASSPEAKRSEAIITKCAAMGESGSGVSYQTLLENIKILCRVSGLHK